MDDISMHSHAERGNEIKGKEISGLEVYDG